MFSAEADLFFRAPDTPPQVPGTLGILYLLRRDVQQCLGINPTTGYVVGPRILWPGAMAVLAGVDLLAKFQSGSDGSGVGQRFRDYLDSYFQLTGPDDSEILYQLRCSLLHSFGLYSHANQQDYHFYVVQDESDLLVSASPDYHVVDLVVMQQRFEQSIALYQAALETTAQLQQNFTAMFPKYGALKVG